LDHGDRCYTVSGNLGSVEVHVGDELAEGEKIGTVGNSSGDGKGPALYFEIRIDNDKVPPSAWLGL
jgi:septal ring factor EnvC (AmiA/AmiB activator)